jgi:hypothetical protein
MDIGSNDPSGVFRDFLAFGLDLAGEARFF